MSLNRRAIANQGISFSALLKALQGLTGEAAESTETSAFGASYKTIYGRLASERDLYRFLAEKEECKQQELLFKKAVLMLKEKKLAERAMLTSLAEYKAVMTEYEKDKAAAKAAVERKKAKI